MKILLNVRMVLLLVAMGLLTVFTSCGNLDKKEMEEIEDLQESFPSSTVRAELVTITGTILDPETQEPLEGVSVTIGTETAITDENGFYSITLEETNAGALVVVDLEGYVDLVFPVSFENYTDGDSVDWAITLPESQPASNFTPGEETVDTFTYLGVVYTVTIPADATDSAIPVSVGPSGTVVGAGISGSFATVGVHVETEEEDFNFDNEVGVSYDPLEAATSGGIGSINPAATEPDAPPEAAAAAAAVQDAVDAAQEILDEGGDPSDANAAFVEELYEGADEVSINEDGEVVIVTTVEGGVLPGNGVVTEDGNLTPIDEEGEPIEDEVVVIIDEETGEVPDIPHQSTADGDG